MLPISRAASGAWARTVAPRLFSSTSRAMVVRTVASEAEFNTLIQGTKPVIVDWWATWCGPCRHISPVFKALSEQTEGLEFVAVDVDDQLVGAKLATAWGIRAMPTFHVFLEGQKAAEVIGADRANLEGLISRFSA